MGEQLRLSGVRDQYLALLLTDSKPADMALSTDPAAPTWTPGAKFKFTPTPQTHLSQTPAFPQAPPVTSPPHFTTPYPAAHSFVTATDADVRVAELTASLVAANENGNRQAEAIRRLSEQLRRTERKVQLYHRKRTSRPSSFPSAKTNNIQSSTISSDSFKHQSVVYPEHESTFDGDRSQGRCDWKPRHHQRPHFERNEESGRKITRHSVDLGHRRRQSNTMEHDKEGTRNRGSPRNPDADFTSAQRKRDRVRLQSAKTIHEPLGRSAHEHREDMDVDTGVKLGRRREKELDRKVKQYEKEIAIFSHVFEDVKRGQQRLIDERATHLRLIERQRELLELFKANIPYKCAQDSSDGNMVLKPDVFSPEPVSRRRNSMPVSNGCSYQSFSGNEQRTKVEESIGLPYSTARVFSASVNDNEESDIFEEDRVSTSANPKYQVVDAVLQAEPATPSRTEMARETVLGTGDSPRGMESQTRFNLASQDATPHGKIPKLTEDYDRIHHQIPGTSRREWNSKDADKTQKVESETSTKLGADIIERLVEEIDALEGVAKAIQFGTTVKEICGSAGGMQRNAFRNCAARYTGTSIRGETDVLADASDRIAKIRSLLHEKYSRSLGNVCNENVTTASPHIDTEMDGNSKVASCPNRLQSINAPQMAKDTSSQTSLSATALTM